MTDSPKKPKAPTLRTIASRRPTSSASSIPRAPEVDDEALRRAEGAMEFPERPADQTRRRGRRKKPQSVVLYVRGPKPVVEAFHSFRESQDYATSWAALEALLLKAGIEIEDFDA
jgi:hypothetical protein